MSNTYRLSDFAVSDEGEPGDQPIELLIERRSLWIEQTDDGKAATNCRACTQKRKQGFDRPRAVLDTYLEAARYLDAHRASEGHARSMREAFDGPGPSDEERTLAEVFGKPVPEPCGKCGKYHKAWTTCAPLPERFVERP